MPARPDWTVLALTGSVAGLLLTPLCGSWFSCGCDWPWAGLYIHCNALQAGAPEPHCPWCVHPLVAVTAIGFAALIALLAVMAVCALRADRSAAMLLAWSSGIAAFTLALAFTGWITAILTHHPSFLGMPLS